MRVARFFSLSTLFMFAFISAFAFQSDAGRETPAEQAVATSRAERATVPRMVRFSGAVRTADGAALTGVVALTFSLYADAKGGAPLWMETQNVTLDEQGRYTVLIGATTSEGLPLSLFAKGEARWIGVRVAEEGAAELPRVQLVSVPYALAAADSLSLGGRPVSDFMLTRAAAAASGGAQAGRLPDENTGTVTSAANTIGRLAKFTALDTLGNSLMFESGGIVFIDSGLALPATTSSTTGVINSGGSRFIHNFGTQNTFVGVTAGNFTMTGAFNTASGFQALLSNTSGTQNTASGVAALLFNTTGSYNTATGVSALSNNTTGGLNTAYGAYALDKNTSGSDDTATGYLALRFNTTGVENTATGFSALTSNTTGSYNTAMGSNAMANNANLFSGTATGASALFSNTTGNWNTADGAYALYSNTIGDANTAVGLSTLYSNTTGSYNTAIGDQAGRTGTPANANITGSYNTFIGHFAGPGTPTQLTNATAIGANALVSASNTIVLGDSTVAMKVGIGTNTPTDPLHVNGGIRFGAGSFVAGQAKLFTSAQHGTLLTANTGSSNDIALVSASGNLLLTNPTGTNNLVMLSGGSFGVNTSNVSERLTVNGGIRFGPSSFSAGAPTLYQDSAHGSVLTGSQGTSNDLALVSRVGNLLLTNPTGTNNLVFFSGGNFGLNTFTPTTLLDVAGIIRSSTGGFRFPDNTGQTTAVPSTCSTNQIPKWNGSAWACAADATGGGGGTVTSIATGTGLTGGPITTSGTLSIDTNVVARIGVNNNFTATQNITGSLLVSGNASVFGTLTKGAGSFKIDHPLDPAGKYLSHSFVESPDMKNVYDGLVTLDKHGEAWVQMPDYFDALNRDFRYQLTCVGGFAPVYIAQKVSGNRFKIAGGRSGLEVSWQITGTRQDAYANAHRIPVEEPKLGSEIGTYLHPELFEKPSSENKAASKEKREPVKQQSETH